MKKNILKITLLCSIVIAGKVSCIAQSDYISRANAFIESKDYNKARLSIDSIMLDADYSKNGEAWYNRGFVYKAIYNNKEKGNVESPSRITALESFERSMKYDKSATNVLENKKNIKYLANTLYNDVIKGLDTINYNVAIRNFEKFRKYYALADTSKAQLQNNDISYRLALAAVYVKMFRKTTSHEDKVKYCNLAVDNYTDILAMDPDNQKAKYNLAAVQSDAAAYQINMNERKFKQDLDVKATTINKLDKDNQLKQSEIITKEELLKQIESENNSKTRIIELLKVEKELEEKEIRQQGIIRNTFIGGFIIMLLFSFVIFRQRNKIANEKKRSDELLLNILPEEVAEELKKTGSAKAKHYKHVSVLFTDFVGFTAISEKLLPEELVKEIHSCFTAFDAIIERNGLEKIKTIGDAYLAVCGMPNEDETHAQRTVQAALEIMEFINKRMIEGGKFKIRIGINSGPVIAGIVGVKKFAYDIWGDAVNTAARMEQTSVNGKINISGATYEMIKDDFICTYRGKIEAKNKGEIDMYFVEGKK